MAIAKKLMPNRDSATSVFNFWCGAIHSPTQRKETVPTMNLAIVASSPHGSMSAFGTRGINELKSQTAK